MRCEIELASVLRRAWNEGEPDEQLAVALALAYCDEDPPDLSEHERKYKWVSDLADSLGWHEVVRYRVHFAEHNNMKESTVDKIG